MKIVIWIINKQVANTLNIILSFVDFLSNNNIDITIPSVAPNKDKTDNSIFILYDWRLFKKIFRLLKIKPIVFIIIKYISAVPNTNFSPC